MSAQKSVLVSLIGCGSAIALSCGLLAAPAIATNADETVNKESVAPEEPTTDATPRVSNVHYGRLFPNPTATGTINITIGSFGNDDRVQSPPPNKVCPGFAKRYPDRPLPDGCKTKTGTPTESPTTSDTASPADQNSVIIDENNGTDNGASNTPAVAESPEEKNPASEQGQPTATATGDTTETSGPESESTDRETDPSTGSEDTEGPSHDVTTSTPSVAESPEEQNPGSEQGQLTATPTGDTTETSGPESESTDRETDPSTGNDDTDTPGADETTTPGEEETSVAGTTTPSEDNESKAPAEESETPTSDRTPVADTSESPGGADVGEPNNDGQNESSGEVATEEPSPSNPVMPDTCQLYIVDEDGNPVEGNSFSQRETANGINFDGTGLKAESEYTWAVSSNTTVENAHFDEQADEDGLLAFRLVQEEARKGENRNQGTRTALNVGEYTVTVNGTQGNGESAKDCAVNFTVVADKNSSNDNETSSADKGTDGKDVPTESFDEQESNDSLASTGTTVGTLAGIGALTVAGGVVALVAGRRRAHS
ncbi:hypothetical protein [Auritidibacter ignavus]|uniref:hypothetical protein n=1 Tax=Auritidibacter ignavus TaxID=678932 RepID=UPI0024BA672A|nr:hypothetical protein [Auritidibacter ignavus]WHS27147.1 hypothetical protein QM395_06945 [Auritidibacter ignavus]